MEKIPPSFFLILKFHILKMIIILSYTCGIYFRKNLFMGKILFYFIKETLNILPILAANMTHAQFSI